MDDLQQLYYKITQHLEHYEIVAGPTVTVNVGFLNQEKQQFSSWERFKLLDVGKTEIVDDVVIKFEFVIKLPGAENTQKPQRYILTIDIDSKLSLLADKETETIFFNVFPFPFAFEHFPSLTISIDFVDYICAKIFSQVVEEWCKTLEESRNPKWLERARRSSIVWPFFFSQFGNIGAAIFIALYTYLKNGNIGSVAQIVYLASFTFMIWTLSNYLCRQVGYLFNTAIVRSFIPAVVLLTAGDNRAFQKIQERTQTKIPRLISYTLAIPITVGLNVLASFIYKWIT